MLKFEFASTITLTEPDSDKRYVLYSLSVKQNNGEIDVNPSYIHRRYSQYLVLYNNLRREFPTLMSKVFFPKKVLMGNYDAGLISCRSACFTSLLEHIANDAKLRDAPCTIAFFQDVELNRAQKLMDENTYDKALTVLESLFTFLNKVYTDRSHIVIIMLCRLVSCGIGGSLATSLENGVLAGPTERWAKLALHRFEAVSDTDLLSLYVPLIKACVLIWKTLGKDSKPLEDKLDNMKRVGMRVDNCPSLNEAIEKLKTIVF